MTFEKYRKQLGKLSEVKLKILDILWTRGQENCFPKEWVESEEILELTKQKYFDRRIRELRDEKGCDIETGFNSKGKASYKLRSEKIKKGNKRSYLSAKQKKELFEKEKYECQICSKRLRDTENKPQADHKKPLSRGGGHELENWQTVCVECNVAKRRACQNCSIDCSNCSWAFPEKKGIVLQIHLSKFEYQNIMQKSNSDSIAEVQNYLSEIIKQNID